MISSEGDVLVDLSKRNGLPIQRLQRAHMFSPFGGQRLAEIPSVPQTDHVR